MKNSIKWVIIAALLVGLIGGSTILYNNLSKEYKANNIVIVSSSKKAETTPTSSVEGEGEVSSQFSNLSELKLMDYEGYEINFTKFAGKPIVLNFWTSWCGYCKQEMPDFEKAAKAYPDVQFVMVNATCDKRETEVAARDYIESTNYDLDFYFDVNKEAVVEYNIRSYPTTYFLDSEGFIISYSPGSLDYDDLVECIEMIREK